MLLIKISSKYQITIPKIYRKHCSTSWLSVSSDGKVITLRSIEVKEAQTENEIFGKHYLNHGEIDGT